MVDGIMYRRSGAGNTIFPIHDGVLLQRPLEGLPQLRCPSDAVGFDSDREVALEFAHDVAAGDSVIRGVCAEEPAAFFDREGPGEGAEGGGASGQFCVQALCQDRRKVDRGVAVFET